MIIVKLTVLLVVVNAIYIWCIRNYLSKNIGEALIYNREDYMPIYKIISALLNIFTIIGIFASAIYLLFFR